MSSNIDLGFLLTKMNYYWGQNENLDSVPAISSELTELSKEITKVKELATEQASELIQKGDSKEAFIQRVTIQLNKWCKETQRITEAYERILEFKIQLAQIDGSVVDCIQEASIKKFKMRVDQLGLEIEGIKKYHLFPFFQMVENVKAGWDPLGKVRWVLDWVWDWKTPDPMKDLAPFFKNTVN